MGGGGIAPRILNLVTPRPHYSLEKDPPVSFVKETGWAPDLVRTLWRRGKIMCLLGIETWSSVL